MHPNSVVDDLLHLVQFVGIRRLIISGIYLSNYLGRCSADGGRSTLIRQKSQKWLLNTLSSSRECDKLYIQRRGLYQDELDNKL